MKKQINAVFYGGPSKRWKTKFHKNWTSIFLGIKIQDESNFSCAYILNKVVKRRYYYQYLGSDGADTLCNHT